MAKTPAPGSKTGLTGTPFQKPIVSRKPGGRR